MAGPKRAIFTLIVFVLQLQHIATEAANSSSQSVIPETLLLTAPQSLQYSSVNRYIFCAFRCLFPIPGLGNISKFSLIQMDHIG